MADVSALSDLLMKRAYDLAKNNKQGMNKARVQLFNEGGKATARMLEGGALRTLGPMLKPVAGAMAVPAAGFAIGGGLAAIDKHFVDRDGASPEVTKSNMFGVPQGFSVDTRGISNTNPISGRVNQNLVYRPTNALTTPAIAPPPPAQPPPPANVTPPDSEPMGPPEQPKAPAIPKLTATGQPMSKVQEQIQMPEYNGTKRMSLGDALGSVGFGSGQSFSSGNTLAGLMLAGAQLNNNAGMVGDDQKLYETKVKAMPEFATTNMNLRKEPVAIERERSAIALDGIRGDESRARIAMMPDEARLHRAQATLAEHNAKPENLPSRDELARIKGEEDRKTRDRVNLGAIAGNQNIPMDLPTRIAIGSMDPDTQEYVEPVVGQPAISNLFFNRNENRSEIKAVPGGVRSKAGVPAKAVVDALMVKYGGDAKRAADAYRNGERK